MEQKSDFVPFKVGTVFNSIKCLDKKPKSSFQSIEINYPTRLEAMALDPSKIATNENLKYSAGQIDFTVSLFRTAIIKKRLNDDIINISKKSPRKSLILHATLLMKTAIGFECGLDIDFKDPINLRHCGLGSSSGTIATIASAINELFGSPIKNDTLIKYLAQNHGEEIDGFTDMINPVQCIGGSAACGLHGGGMFILAGESEVIKSMNISSKYDVIVAVPNNFKYPDSKYLLEKEIENFPKFIACGKKYGPQIAYRIVHDVIPAMCNKDIKPAGNLIFEYRFDWGSINNCSFVYPPINDIATKLRFLKNENIVDVLALSSVGPGFFVLTKNRKKCEEIFKSLDMKTITTKIHNKGYIIKKLS
jgi:predicted sugar kinase